MPSAVPASPSSAHAMPWPSGPSLIVLTAAIALGYYFAARLSLLLQIQPENIAVFWPASGLSAGALLALGSRYWAPVSLAVILATVAANVGHGASLTVATLFGMCNALECVLVAAMTERARGRKTPGPFELDSLGNLVAFLAAAVLGTAIAALPAALTLIHVQSVPVELGTLWVTWIKSDAVGVVTAAPLLIALPEMLRSRTPRRRLMEGAAVLAAMMSAVTYQLLVPPAAASWPTVILLGMVLPLLLWLAVRTPPVFAFSGILVVAISIVYLVISGQGTLGQSGLPIGERVFVAQLLILTLALCALALAALTAGQRNIEAQLRTKEQRLRIATAAARLGVFEWHIKEDRAVWENDRMFELFGHGKEEGPLSFEQVLNHYIAPSQRDLIAADSQRSLIAGEISSVMHIRRKDGEWRNIEVIGTVEKDDDGSPVRVVGVMADITERQRIEAQQSLLIGELDHRVKNALARITSLVASTRAGSKGLDDFIEAFVGRIHSMARAHQLLSREHWSGVDLETLVREHLEPYDAPGRIAISGPKVRLGAEATQALSMVFHELATNAAKYGALLAAAGCVDVTWSIEPDASRGMRSDLVVLEWRERNGPPVRPPQQTGFGTRVIKMPIVYELDGHVDLEFLPEGVRCRIRVPMQRLAGS
jgi:PAS domain S-box-containing protein